MTRGSLRAFSLIEALVAVAILAVLLTMAMPRLRRANEQMHLDAAALRLRSIWSAQRVHWLEHGTFASSLPDLAAEGLVDLSIASGSDGSWTYIVGSPTAEVFRATAERNSGGWDGTLAIDETGALTGSLKSPDGGHLQATQQ